MEIITRAEARAQGLKRYYVEPCVHGHTDGRSGASNRCAACEKISREKYRAPDRGKYMRRRAATSEARKAYDREYRQKNGDAIRAKWRAWYALPENAEKHKQHSREYAQANSELVARRARQYYAENVEKIRESSRRWREANREGLLKKKRAYHAANKDAIRERRGDYFKRHYEANKPMYAARVRERQARKRNATPAWADAEMALRVYEDSAAFADFLGEPCHVDHIIPLHGVHPETGEHIVSGLHTHQNLRVIVARQNLSRSNKWHPDWTDRYPTPKPPRS